MADDDANLPDAYDLVPVDHTPQFSDAPIPKAGQTVQQPNVMGDISSMPGKVASAVGDVTGVTDAYKAATGQMTPDEAQMFALGALPMLAGGPEAKAVGEVASDIAPEISKGIRAFHGSPYDFNQFDLSKIGTGEGAQAYGHGLYFAENPGTAESYKKNLAPASADIAPSFKGDGWQVTTRDGANYGREFFPTQEEAQAHADKFNKGKMYEVNINADPEHFLDWDKPLSEHPPEVQDKVKQAMGVDYYGNYDPQKAERVWNQFGTAQAGTAVKNGFIAFNDETVAQRLRDAGIPGIKYLDQGSRGTGQGTSNYVVFNDKIIDIVKKYGLAGLIAGGASHFQTVPVDHQPAFAEQQGMATGGSVKATKTQANYRGGTENKRCGNCKMFVVPDSCTAVRGKISPRGLCDYFESAGAKRANGGRVIAANIEHEPSEAQKEAGNYAKDHVRVHGLDITIENAKGHHRRGVDRGGKPWSVKMPAHYGYIKGTVGKDKDHVDVYLGPHLNAPNVWVLDQMNAESKQFDEHKTFVGFASKDQVVDTYRKAFSDGKANDRLGHLTRMTVPAFKQWLESGNMDRTANDHFADAVKIDATHDGPWMSCMSIDGGTMYRNKNIPATANIKGKTVDVNDMLLHHEVPERDDLEKLIAEFKARFKREPNTKERKAIYLKAHNRSGTPNERAYAKKIDVDWKAWSAWCRGEEAKIEKGPFTNQPKDADVKPIPHSHGDLEAVGSREAA